MFDSTESRTFILGPLELAIPMLFSPLRSYLRFGIQKRMSGERVRFG